MAQRSSVTVVGIPRAISRLENLAEREHRAVVEAVAEETEEIAGEMRRDAPVGDRKRGRRGRPPLAESVEAVTDGLSGQARATARHAHLVEDGTSSHPAQPFVKPAGERARKRFPQRVTRGIRQANTGAGS